MYRQLKQTALPYRLRGEHIRAHYSPMCQQRPRTDVVGRVLVGRRLAPARNAVKPGLVRSVPLVDTAARGALTRRVTGIDAGQWHTNALCLVAGKGARLAKGPVGETGSLAASGRDPAANASKLFEGNAATGALRFLDESLGYHVVLVGLVSPLFASQLTKAALRTLGADPLQISPAFLMPAPLCLDIIPGVNAAVTVNRETDDPEVNTKPVLRIKFLRTYCFSS